jgi:hypothetical protein
LSDEEINDLLEKKGTFEKHLSDSKELLHIRGYSGCGKSVYLNYCLHKIREERESFIFNLEGNPGLIKGPKDAELDITSESNNSPNIAPWLFAGLLLDKTYHAITDILEKESQEIIAGIQKQHKYLDDNEIGGNGALFAAFKKIDRNDDNLGNETKRKIFNELTALLHRNNGRNDIRSIIQRILDALTKFLFCYVEARESINNERVKRYIFAFDNIEHYIKDSFVIFDEDIVTITTAVEQFIYSAKGEYDKIEKTFSDYFKFIFAIRDTTAKFLISSTHGSAAYGDVNVSSWYVFKEIQRKKERIFEKINPDYNTEKVKKSLSLFNVITGDITRFGQNINILFSEMYNYNKRRTVRILNKIIRKMIELESGNKNLTTLGTFQSYWSESPVSYKYLCRRAIIRLILDFINFDSLDKQEVSFFDAIHVKHEGGEIGTYARRVLCFLLYESSGKIDERYVSFYNLIKGIFEPRGDKTINENAFNELAEVLLAMNESSFVKYNWVQLIVIKFNATSSITKEALVRKLQESCKTKIEDEKDFGIRVTNAGRFFAYIQSDFEYFASRYCNKIAAFSPLVWIKDIKTIKDIIAAVFIAAKTCMETVVRFDRDYFLNFETIYQKKYFYEWTLLGNKKSKMPHPYRIIDTHLVYLDHYKNFLDAEKEKNRLSAKGEKLPSVFSDSDIEVLQKYTAEYITKYREVFSTFESEADEHQNGYFDKLDKNLPRHRVNQK